jgi:hypothetical protein
MNPQEQRVRDDLAVLAASDRGRELLQLALRGIGRGDRAVTAGCWADRGVADWNGSFVGAGDYGIVIRTIGAFDVLAKDHYADVKRRRLLPDRVEVRQDQWRELVERILVATLAAGETRDGGETKEVAAVS